MARSEREGNRALGAGEGILSGSWDVVFLHKKGSIFGTDMPAMPHGGPVWRFDKARLDDVFIRCGTGRGSPAFPHPLPNPEAGCSLGSVKFGIGVVEIGFTAGFNIFIRETFGFGNREHGFSEGVVQRVLADQGPVFYCDQCSGAFFF